MSALWAYYTVLTGDEDSHNISIWATLCKGLTLPRVSGNLLNQWEPFAVEWACQLWRGSCLPLVVMMERLDYVLLNATTPRCVYITY